MKQAKLIKEKGILPVIKEMREGKVALSKLAKIVKQPRDQQLILKKTRAENSKPKKHSKKAKASKNKEADPVEEMSKIEETNSNPKPFVWTADPKRVVAANWSILSRF